MCGCCVGGDPHTDMKTTTTLIIKALDRFTLINPPTLFLFSFLVDPMDDLKLPFLVLLGLCNRGTK